jgi:hypothetical protein
MIGITIAAILVTSVSWSIAGTSFTTGLLNGAWSFGVFGAGLIFSRAFKEE